MEETTTTESLQNLQISNNDNKTTILIVGCGLAGLSLSLGLVHFLQDDDNVRVVIMERNENFFREYGATFGLAPNGKKALHELMGIENSSGSGEKKKRSVVESIEQQGVALPNGSTMLGWWMVRDTLLEKVKSNPKIEILMGYTIQDIVDDEQNPYVEAICQKTNATENDDALMKLRGCLIVGADGVNSGVRQILQLPKATLCGVSIWRCKLDVPVEKPEKPTEHDKHYDLLRPLLDKGPTPLGVQVHGPNTYVLFNFHENSPGTMAVVFTSKEHDGNVPKGTHPLDLLQKHFPTDNNNNKEINDEENKQEQWKILKAMCEIVQPRSTLQHPIKMKVIPTPTDNNKWGGKGRIVLLGDAAHGMRPASGLGGAMAFEDSCMLCRVIQQAFSNNTKANNNKQDKEWMEQHVVHKFEEERNPRVDKIWKDQWEKSEASYKQGKITPWTKEFEEWVYAGI